MTKKEIEGTEKTTNPSATSSDTLSHNGDMLHRLQRPPRMFLHLPDQSSTNSDPAEHQPHKVPEDPAARNSAAHRASSGVGDRAKRGASRDP